MKFGEYFKGRDYSYVMHLNYGTGTNEDRRKYWHYAKDHQLIGLDRQDVNMNWNNKTEVEKETFRSHSPQWYSQFEIFCNEMKRHDFIIAMAGTDSLLGFGTVSRNEYDYLPRLKDNRTFFDHVRHVDWIRVRDYDKHLKLAKSLKGFDRTLLKITPDHKFWKILVNIDF